MLAFFKWAAASDLGMGPELIDPTKVWKGWIPYREGKQGGYDNCGPNWPCDNVWLGVSVEDQDTADERIPLLQQTPAAVRWISAEPLLGAIDLSEYLKEQATVVADSYFDFSNKLNWIVAGGESGPHARPSHPNWFRSLRDQCQTARVPFFFKQWGEWHPCETEVHADERGREIYPHDENLFDNLERSSGFPVIEAHLLEFFKAGKKLAGRVLDGRTWDEYPRGRSL